MLLDKRERRCATREPGHVEDFINMLNVHTLVLIWLFPIIYQGVGGVPGIDGLSGDKGDTVRSGFLLFFVFYSIWLCETSANVFICMFVFVFL